MCAITKLKGLMRLGTVRSAVVPFGGAVCAAIGVAVASGPAQAYIFTFEDQLYIANQSTWTSTFAPYTGPPFFGSAGMFQVLQTTNGQTWTAGSPSPPNPAPAYVFKTQAAGGGFKEFIQNDPNFPTTPPANGSQTEDALIGTLGWGSGQLVNGQAIHNVTTSTTGAYFFFTAPTGNGVQTAFTLNGFDLTGTAQGVVFQVLDQSNNVLYTTPTPLNLSSTVINVPVETLNAWKVVYLSNTTGGSVMMDNVEINDALPAVPELSTWAMMVVGFACLGLVRRSKAARSAFLDDEPWPNEQPSYFPTDF